jgi:hypothetical protein
MVVVVATLAQEVLAALVVESMELLIRVVFLVQRLTAIMPYMAAEAQEVLVLR